VRRAKRKTTVPPRPKVTARVNDQITAATVRVIDEEGTQVGVLGIAEARALAAERSLDLIEVSSEADPPVCRIGDYGRWRFEEERRLRAGRRQQVHSAPKEVRLRPRIATHDYAWKRDQAIGFLRARSKVKLIVMFRGREREHPELGRQLLARLAADVADVGHLDGRESFEGRSMTVLLSPNGATR
jgi:translation initiation factor IF-3